MGRIAVSAAFLTLSGCAVRGAPSFVLFGAYFPAWMFCALIGILAASASRVGMVASGVSEELPLQLFICVSVGVIAAIGSWPVWFDW